MYGFEAVRNPKTNKESVIVCCNEHIVVKKLRVIEGENRCLPRKTYLSFPQHPITPSSESKMELTLMS